MVEELGADTNTLALLRCLKEVKMFTRAFVKTRADLRSDKAPALKHLDRHLTTMLCQLHGSDLHPFFPTSFALNHLNG